MYWYKKVTTASRWCNSRRLRLRLTIQCSIGFWNNEQYIYKYKYKCNTCILYMYLCTCIYQKKNLTTTTTIERSFKPRLPCSRIKRGWAFVFYNLSLQLSKGHINGYAILFDLRYFAFKSATLKILKNIANLTT